MFVTSILTMVQLHSYTYTYRIISTENRHVYVSEGDFPEKDLSGHWYLNVSQICW